ncbi:hypothetical protein RND81_06G160600 [Saponaria officinalis]|uniref:Endonuclease/exonuclease/phosphatase domain-containing protein n=1 Tax=Saponaria officinalis TaxID=3572 RepID=A0AAW1KDN3_SAPOF
MARGLLKVTLLLRHWMSTSLVVLLMIIATWNVRGINHPSKQQELKQFFLKHKVDVMGVLETRVKAHKFMVVQRGAFSHNWRLEHNYAHHPNGRIWLAWNKANVLIKDVQLSPQMISCLVHVGKVCFFLSIVYGFNTRAGRQALWEELGGFARSCRLPWILMGDFNVVLHNSEKRGVNQVDHGSMADFLDCCQMADIMDLPYRGRMFTWCNKQLSVDRTWCKLDRVMGNRLWFQAGLDVAVDFLEPGISDHSPALVSFTSGTKLKKKQFKYLNGWSAHQGFLELIKDNWFKGIRGTKMFCLTERLKAIKGVLKELHSQHFIHISQWVIEARSALHGVQRLLSDDPGSVVLMEQEQELLRKFLLLQRAELSFLKQRSKIRDVQFNDDNTAYFHAKVREHVCRNKVSSISFNGCLLTEDEAIGEAFVSYYSSLLGQAQPVGDFWEVNMSGARLSDDMHYQLIHPLLDSEVKEALFSIDDDKAPGLDGFTSGFFKHTWDVTG